MRDYNCPNCGAPVTSHICEYCGTVIFDFGEISMEKPCWVAVDFGDGAKRLVRVKVREWQMNSDCTEDVICDYGGRRVARIVRTNTPSLKAVFDLLPDDNSVYLMAKERRKN